MPFSIPCETYVRLSNVSLRPDDANAADHFRSVRVEHINGKKFAVASNSYILAAEFLGDTPEPDGAVNIAYSEALIEQCQREVEFDSMLTVTVGGGWGLAITGLGYAHPGNAAVAGEWPRWRNLIPVNQVARRYKSAAVFNQNYTMRLMRAAPSGEIILPKIVDGGYPVVVRDLVEPTWFGFFMTGLFADQPIEPAEIPDWIKRHEAAPDNNNS